MTGDELRVVQPRRTSPLPTMLTAGTAAPVWRTRPDPAIEMLRR